MPSNKIIDSNGNVYANTLFVSDTIELTGSTLVTTDDLANIQLIAGNGLSGGGNISANVTISANVQEILDQTTTTRGSILYRGAGGWNALTPGTNGYVLQSGGTGADPSWISSGATANVQALLDSISSTQGAVLYRSASGWAALPPGTAGQILQSGGAAANPSWGGATSLTRPSVVQQATACGNSGSVTLGSSPTPGNLLVCVASHYQNVPATSVTTGWNVLLNKNGSSTDGNFIATKIVDNDDTTTISVYGNEAGCNITVFEIANAFGVVVLPWKDIQEQTGLTTTTLNVGIPSASCLLVGAFATVSANAAPTGITGATASATVTGTSTSASPRQMTAFVNDTVSKGNQKVVATYSGTPRSYGYAVVALPSI